MLGVLGKDRDGNKQQYNQTNDSHDDLSPPELVVVRLTKNFESGANCTVLTRFNKDISTVRAFRLDGVNITGGLQNL
jgi:hypothetical protein